MASDGNECAGKPADLPVQLSVKYETVLNMTTAKALGLEPNKETILSLISSVYVSQSRRRR